MHRRSYVVIMVPRNNEMKSGGEEQNVPPKMKARTKKEREQTRSPPFLLRRTIVNRTYGTHQNLHIHLFLSTIFGPFITAPLSYKKCFNKNSAGKNREKRKGDNNVIGNEKTTLSLASIGIDNRTHEHRSNTNKN